MEYESFYVTRNGFVFQIPTGKIPSNPEFTMQDGSSACKHSQKFKIKNLVTVI